MKVPQDLEVSVQEKQVVFTIKKPSRDLTGPYTIKMSNAAGTSSKDVNINMQDKPSPPTNLKVCCISEKFQNYCSDSLFKNKVNDISFSYEINNLKSLLVVVFDVQDFVVNLDNLYERKYFFPFLNILLSSTVSGD